MDADGPDFPDWIEIGRLAAGPIPLGERDIRALHTAGIRAIVTLTEYPLTTQREITPALLADLDMAVFDAPIRDGFPPDVEQAAHIMRFIREAEAQGRPVYLHCHAGIGRTGTLLHVYFMDRGLTLAESQERVLKARASCSFRLLTTWQREFLTDYAQRRPSSFR
jgi:atypical dual specificity phosphatase